MKMNKYGIPTLITLLFLIGVVVESTAQVVLNEVCSDNESSLLIGDKSPDWIELRNTGDSEVNLMGYFLSDDDDDPQKWIFPSITISANSYLLVLADGKDKIDDYVHTNFKLSSSGEKTLVLN